MAAVSHRGHSMPTEENDHYNQPKLLHGPQELDFFVWPFFSFFLFMCGSAAFQQLEATQDCVK